MPKTSKAQIVDQKINICQGDVFHDVHYTYIDSENNDNVEIVEFVFPMAIIVSQACDVNSMGEIISDKSGKATKFMPSILMCPIYDVDEVKKTSHLENVFKELNIQKIDGKDERLLYGDDIKVAKKDWHYRFHNFSISINDNNVLDNALIDFKHYFTVPASYLMKNRNKRAFHLEDIYAEQITLKFATYLSRVAIP